VFETETVESVRLWLIVLLKDGFDFTVFC